MFDVTWTDPGVEKVGERKARKEKEQDSQVGQDDRFSKRVSNSTGRSSSSAGKSTMTKAIVNKPSSLFGGFSLRKKRLSSKSKLSRGSDLQIPIPGPNTATPSLPTASTFCSTFSSADFFGQDSSRLRINPDARHALEPVDTSWDQLEDFQIVPNREAGLSKSTPGIALGLNSPQDDSSAGLTAGTTAEFAQHLGPDSWITKETEIMVEVKHETGADCTRSKIAFPLERVPAGPHTHAHLVSHEEDGATNLFPDGNYNIAPLTCARVYTPCRPHGTIRSSKTPETSISNPPRSLTRFRAHDPSRWKAPVMWDMEELCARDKGFNLEEQFRAVNRPGNDSLADLASVQREIKKMALLVPASIVFRLEEKLADSPNLSAYKETEMERKRLMLFALGVFRDPYHGQSPIKPAKLLALFENEATASFLAAVNPESSITHLSPSPLSALLFPNVRPLVSPTHSNAVLSVAQNQFSAVYCLSLPSVFSSQEIPVVLRNIYTRLRPGGILHLVLINPAPATRSLGTHMRQWLEDNLLLNLERKFRCTNPRKLIPIWLGDVGLRANDSTKTTVKCQAVFQETDKKEDKGLKDKNADDEEDFLNILYGGRDAAKREQQTKLELQSKIGRLLWQETWGSFVNAKRWWWDDPHCVEECKDLGTYWEYSIIESVKDS